jgi:hypothetical protein
VDQIVWGWESRLRGLSEQSGKENIRR